MVQRAAGWLRGCGVAQGLRKAQGLREAQRLGRQHRVGACRARALPAGPVGSSPGRVYLLQGGSHCLRPGLEALGRSGKVLVKPVFYLALARAAVLHLCRIELRSHTAQVPESVSAPAEATW